METGTTGPGTELGCGLPVRIGIRSECRPVLLLILDGRGERDTPEVATPDLTDLTPGWSDGPEDDGTPDGER